MKFEYKFYIFKKPFKTTIEAKNRKEADEKFKQLVENNTNVVSVQKVDNYYDIDRSVADSFLKLIDTFLK